MFANLSTGVEVGLKSKGELIDSTHIRCFVPINKGEIKLTNINITLNDQ
jgi:hypothetical protein